MQNKKQKQAQTGWRIQVSNLKEGYYCTKLGGFPCHMFSFNLAWITKGTNYKQETKNGRKVSQMSCFIARIVLKSFNYVFLQAGSPLPWRNNNKINKYINKKLWIDNNEAELQLRVGDYTSCAWSLLPPCVRFYVFSKD